MGIKKQPRNIRSDDSGLALLFLYEHAEAVLTLFSLNLFRHTHEELDHAAGGCCGGGGGCGYCGCGGACLG